MSMRWTVTTRMILKNGCQIRLTLIHVSVLCKQSPTCCNVVENRMKQCYAAHIVYSHELSTIVFSIVKTMVTIDSGSTIFFNIVDNFICTIWAAHHYSILFHGRLIIFDRVKHYSYTSKTFVESFKITNLQLGCVFKYQQDDGFFNSLK